MKRYLLLLSFVLFILPMPLLAQDEGFTSRETRAEVISIQQDETVDGVRQMIFTAREADGTEHSVDSSRSFTEGVRFDLREGTTVILQIIPDLEGNDVAHLSDVVRTNALIWILIAFAAVIIAVGAWRGVFALIGLATTVGVLFAFILPRILAGGDPVLFTVIGSIIILAVNMHLAHGWSKTTNTAFLASIIGLVIAFVFSKLFVWFAMLSGLAAEEPIFLYWQLEGLDPTGLLLAGIILGAVGVLDDISVTQGEIVEELHKANEKLDRNELFTRALRVGRHHIASVVNTLVLAYAGVAMPLFLLFMLSTASTPDFFNLELIAEEIVRTVAGTLALVLTVPISTWLAAARHAKAST